MLQIIIKNKDDIKVFEGTHYEVGKKIGIAFKDSINTCAKYTARDYPLSKKKYDLLTKKSVGKLIESHPEVYEELLGISKGSDIPFAFFYVNSIYEDARDDAEEEKGNLGCTDIFVTGNRTKNGRTLHGHNNDLSIFPWNIKTYRVKVKNKPDAIMVSPDGSILSIGANEAGIIMSGNQLNSYDTVSGIPRIVIARAILFKDNINDALSVCNNSQRASSYNNIIINNKGDLVSYEGTAKKYAILKPKDDLFVHTNHYTVEKLKHFDTSEPDSSTYDRLTRAKNLLNRSDQHDIQSFKKILSDHHGDPQYICRHENSGTKTYFSCIFEPEIKRMHLAVGNPCKNKFKKISY